MSGILKDLENDIYNNLEEYNGETSGYITVEELFPILKKHLNIINEQICKLEKTISEITADMSNVDDIERTSENE